MKNNNAKIYLERLRAAVGSEDYKIVKLIGSARVSLIGEDKFFRVGDCITTDDADRLCNEYDGVTITEPSK